MATTTGAASPAREKGREEVAVLERRSRGGARAGKGGSSFVVQVGFAGAHLCVELVLRGEGDVLGAPCPSRRSTAWPSRSGHRGGATLSAPRRRTRASRRRRHARADGAPRSRARRAAHTARAAASAAARARAEAPRASADPALPESVVAAQPSGRRRGRERSGAAGGVHRACRARGRGECEWRKTSGACARADRSRAGDSARTPAPEPRPRRDGCHSVTGASGGRCGSRSRREGR